MPAGHEPHHDTDVAGPGTSLLSDRYRLDALIGQGGVGTVWRARDLQLDRDVAVKQLQPGVASDPMAADRFRREATTAASLSHTSLVTIYDVGEDDGAVYLVMELVDGPSVKDVLIRGGALSPGETAALGYCVAGALTAVHERGLVHRDVKPGNVLLPVDGPPKLVDFGTVHVLGDRAATLTTPGTMLGTIGYVAPEQFEGHDVDPRADVYAVGLLLHECLTGVPTFGTGSIAEMTRRRLSDDAAPPSHHVAGVPAELDAVVERATRRDPAERFADADELVRALAPLVPSDGAGRLQALARQYAPAATGTDAEGTSALPQTTTVVSRPAAGDTPSAPADTPDATSVLPAAGGTDRHLDDGPEGPGAAARPPTQRRRWMAPLAVAAVVVAVLGAVGISILAAGDGDGGADGSDGQADGDATLAVADASDFDPLGGGSEHGEDIGLAHDGDPGTAWETEGYNQPDLAPKAGVGMWARADGQPSSVQVDLVRGGSTVQLFAFEGEPPTDPAQWGEPIGGASGEDRITADVPEGRPVVLVWFTELPPDGGRHRGGVAEVTFAS